MKISLKNLCDTKLWHFYVWPSLFIALFVIGYRMGLWLSFISTFIYVVGVMSITYLNLYMLMPRFLKRHKNGLHISVSLTVFFVFVYLFSRIDIYIFRNYIEELITDEAHKNPPIALVAVIKYTISFFLAFFISTIIYISSKAQEGIKKWNELQKEKAEMELKFLKSQLNPHFVFNALNTIYCKVYAKEEDAGDSIFMLSDMLRYMFDDCSKDQVTLEKEIQYLRNYIAFQEMKLDTQPKINFSTNITHKDRYIAPLLFQPFIENCFKHSDIHSNEKGFVDISLVEKKNIIYLRTCNSISSLEIINSSSRVGIGLTNIRKQLELTYPNGYELDFNIKDSVFEVNLTINLNLCEYERIRKE